MLPGGRGRFSRLPLDFALLAQAVTQSLLHLCWDVRRRLADLHGRLQEFNRAAPIDLYLWHLSLLLILRLVLRRLSSHEYGRLGFRIRRNGLRHLRWGWGRLRKHPLRAVVSMGRERLASPNGPAQLPKDKERDYQKGEATETYDHS